MRGALTSTLIVVPGARTRSSRFFFFDDSCRVHPEDGELVITFTKVQVGATWTSAFKGHAIDDPVEKEKDQKKLMMERFQRENPHMDFSRAEFNGAVPDARTFMGGIDSKDLR